MSETKSGPLTIGEEAGIWVRMDDWNELTGRLLMHREAWPIMKRMNDIALPIGDDELMEREGKVL